VQGVGVVRRYCQHLAVKPLCLAQVAPLVPRESLGEDGFSLARRDVPRK
jgi:hypothetical protein